MSSSAVEVQEARARFAKVSEDAVTVDLVDGRTIMVPLLWFPRLWNGTPKEHKRLEIIGDGSYIHWPDFDKDLTVAGLLAGHKSGESAESLQKWLEWRKSVERNKRQRRVRAR